MSEKHKYNWLELKLEFFNSDFKEVKGFFQEQYGIYNGHVRSKTLGWTKEKEHWQREMAEKALSELQGKRSESLAANLDMIIVEMQRRIHGPNIIREMKVKELKALWEMMRCENGLSTRIIYSQQQDDKIDLEEARKSLLEKVNSRKL